MDEKYTIDGFDRYLDELLDKMGSDYFPLPIKFNRFVTYAEDFIRENSVYDEVKQEVSDDIKPLRVIKKLAASPSSDRKVLIVPEPTNYFRLINIYPIYRLQSRNSDAPRYEKKCRTVNIDHAGNELINKANPYKTPTVIYPEVRRISSLFEIDMGENVALERFDKVVMTYIKKPTYGNIQNLGDRIINLPNFSIEKIYAKTADSFLFRIGDPTATPNYQFTQTLGRKNK